MGDWVGDENFCKELQSLYSDPTCTGVQRPKAAKNLACLNIRLFANHFFYSWPYSCPIPTYIREDADFLVPQRSPTLYIIIAMVPPCWHISFLLHNVHSKVAMVFDVCDVRCLSSDLRRYKTVLDNTLSHFNSIFITPPWHLCHLQVAHHK